MPRSASPDRSALCRVKKKVAPSPGAPFGQIRPWWRSMICCTVAKPNAQSLVLGGVMQALKRLEQALGILQCSTGGIRQVVIENDHVWRVGGDHRLTRCAIDCARHTVLLAPQMQRNVSADDRA